MAVDRKWLERNIGFDPVATPSPVSSWANRRAARSRAPDDLQREIIDFDSEPPHGQSFKASGTLRQQATMAADIYIAFGRWSSVCSAIVCWALIAAES